MREGVSLPMYGTPCFLMRAKNNVSCHQLMILQYVIYSLWTKTDLDPVGEEVPLVRLVPQVLVQIGVGDLL